MASSARTRLRLDDFQDATGVGDTVAVADQRTFAPLFPSYRSTLADLFGLRFIALGVPAEQIDKKLQPGDLRLIARTKDAYVYENPRALPRVMIVPNAAQADFAKLLREGWPEGFDPRTHVLLEQSPPAAATRRPGSARILRYANTEVVIEADAPDGGYLLLNDVWHPWWRATLDGAPNRNSESQCPVPRGRIAARQTHGGLHIPPYRGNRARSRHTTRRYLKSRKIVSGALVLWREGSVRPVHNSTPLACLKSITGVCVQLCAPCARTPI